MFSPASGTTVFVPASGSEHFFRVFGDPSGLHTVDLPLPPAEWPRRSIRSWAYENCAIS